MQHIQLITFDADDTLWNYTAMIRRGLQAVCDSIHERVTPSDTARLTPERLQDIATTLFRRVDVQTVNYVRARQESFALALAEIGCPDEGFSEELLHLYHEMRDHSFDFFPDLHDTLAALSAHYKLGWITNGETMPEQVGLAEYFTFSINEHTLKLRKPHPEVFRHAARLGGVQAHSILHIGDNLYTDVVGAQGVGGVGVWYNPERLANESHIEPDAEIHSLREVLALLELPH